MWSPGLGLFEFERGVITVDSVNALLPAVYFMLATRPRLPPLRSLASLSHSQINTATQSPYQVFDRHAKRLQKDRAAARDGGNRSRTVDYVRDDVANRMIERFTASILYIVLHMPWLRRKPGYKEKFLFRPRSRIWLWTFRQIARVGSGEESDNAGLE